jgi:hypothetical protein
MKVRLLLSQVDFILLFQAFNTAISVPILEMLIASVVSNTFVDLDDYFACLRFLSTAIEAKADPKTSPRATPIPTLKPILSVNSPKIRPNPAPTAIPIPAPFNTSFFDSDPAFESILDLQLLLF